MKKLLLILFFIPFNIKAVTMEEYREAVANVSSSAASLYSDEFIYSYFWGVKNGEAVDLSGSTTTKWLNLAKNGQKSSGYKYGFKNNPGIQGSFTDKFAVYCETFVKLMVHHASNGSVSYPNDYEKISVSELKKGDLVHFTYDDAGNKKHIAIYIDDAGDNNANTTRVAQASSKIGVAIQTTKPDYGYRLKASALSKLDYNHVTSSYDFHDRLDDYAPIIKNVSLISNSNKLTITATDYKHYDLTPSSDVIEPENNGIIGYQITTTNIVPTSFKTVNTTNELQATEAISKDGTYYVWVKDVGGNVASYTAKITGVLVEHVQPNIGSLKSTIFKNSIFVNIIGASDESGIKEYRYYLDNKLVKTTDSNEYLFDKLDENKKYTIYYEVVDNSNNVAKSQVYTFETIISAKNIILNETYVKLLINDKYQISPRIQADTTDYNVIYSSSNPKVATVNNNGLVSGISSGEATITVSVGKTETKLAVKVLKYNIVFLTKSLPSAYTDTEYEALIETSPGGMIALYSGTLPSGLRIEDNTIKGKPSSVASGKYNFSLIVTVDGETLTQEYSIFVHRKGTFNYTWVFIIIPTGLVGYLIFRRIKKNNNNE